MTQKDIFDIALAQAAADCSCSPKDFLRTEHVVTEARPNPSARRDRPGRAGFPLPALVRQSFPAGVHAVFADPAGQDTACTSFPPCGKIAASCRPAFFIPAAAEGTPCPGRQGTGRDPIQPAGSRPLGRQSPRPDVRLMHLAVFIRGTFCPCRNDLKKSRTTT